MTLSSICFSHAFLRCVHIAPDAEPGVDVGDYRSGADARSYDRVGSGAGEANGIDITLFNISKTRAFCTTHVCAQYRAEC